MMEHFDPKAAARPADATGWSQGLRLPPRTGSSSLVRGGGIDYAELRRLVTIRQVLDLLGWQSTGGRGAQLRGPCPVHGSTTPGSRILSVHLERNLFRCFKCDAHGNQLDLYMAVSRLPLFAACQELCDKLALEPPRSLGITRPRAAVAAKPPHEVPHSDQEFRMSTNRQPPAHEIRYGRIVGKAWKIFGGDSGQRAWYSVQIQRVYKEGEEFRTSDSFSGSDLLLVSKVAERLFTWIHDQPLEHAPH